MSNEVGSRTQAIVFAAVMLFAAPFSGGLSLLALPLAIPIARGSGEKKEEKEKPAEQSGTYSSLVRANVVSRSPFCEHGELGGGRYCIFCQQELMEKERRKMNTLRDEFSVSRFDWNYCWEHQSSKPCRLCGRNVPHGYSYGPPVYSPPSPEDILAQNEPRRTAVLIENLSTDRLAEKFVGVSEEFARQGRGTKIRIRRTGGWFSEPGLDIDINQK